MSRDVDAVVAILEAHQPVGCAPSICGCGAACMSGHGLRRHVAEVIVGAIGARGMDASE